MQIRTALVALVAALVLGTSQSQGGVAGQTQRQGQPAHEISGNTTRTVAAVFIGRSSVSATLTPTEHQLVAWATDRFALVGLDLPDVQVSFHDDTEPCNWNEGIYHGDHGVHRAQICVPDRGTFASDLHRRRTLIHELAHAWEHANLDDGDRQRLLTVLGAEAWFTSELSWEERGGERFAETIVWGLYDQIRRPTLIDASCAKLHADFQFITGHAAPGPVEAVCFVDAEATGNLGPR